MKTINCVKLSHCGKTLTPMLYSLNTMHSSYSFQVQQQHPLVVPEQTASAFRIRHKDLFRAQLLNLGGPAEIMEGVSVFEAE